MPARPGLRSLVPAASTEVEVLDAGPVVVPWALEIEEPELATDGVELPDVELATFELTVLEPVAEPVEPVSEGVELADCPEVADDAADDVAEPETVELPDAAVCEDEAEGDETDDDDVVSETEDEALLTVLLEEGSEVDDADSEDEDEDDDDDVSEALAVLDADAVDSMLILGLVADA